METGSFARPGNHGNRTAVIAGDMFDDGQTNAVARLPGMAIGNPVEALEDALKMFRGNAAAVIPNGEVQLMIRCNRGGNFDPIGAAVQNRVDDQIVECLLQQQRIAGNFQIAAFSGEQLDAGGFCSGSASFERAGDDGLGLYGKEILFGSPAHVFQRVQGEKILQQSMEPF